MNKKTISIILMFALLATILFTGCNTAKDVTPNISEEIVPVQKTDRFEEKSINKEPGRCPAQLFCSLFR